MLRALALGTGILFASFSVSNAATYKIDGFQNFSANGFGSTLFHETTRCGGMCGASADRATGTGSGSWNSTTGAIDFILDLVGGGTATALGTLNTTARNSGSATGVSGILNIIITGSTHGKNGSYDFAFADVAHNSVANWFNNGVVGLWGAAPSSQNNAGALGADFRIEVSQVPLPAGLVLLLTAVGGLGLLRNRNTKANCLNSTASAC